MRREVESVSPFPFSHKGKEVLPIPLSRKCARLEDMQCYICGTRPPWSTRTPKHIPNNVAPNGRVDHELNGDLTRVAVLFWVDQACVLAYSATSPSYSSKAGRAA